MCAGVTSYNAVRKVQTVMRIPPGKPIAVVGAAGGLGHYAVQIAKALGYKVVGIDVGPKRVFSVEKVGADWAVDAGDAVRFIKEKIGGVYAAVITASKITAYDTAIGIVRPGGGVVMVGIPPSVEGPIRAAVPLDLITGYVTLVPAVL